MVLPLRLLNIIGQHLATRDGRPAIAVNHKIIINRFHAKANLLNYRQLNAYMPCINMCIIPLHMHNYYIFPNVHIFIDSCSLISKHWHICGQARSRSVARSLPWHSLRSLTLVPSILFPFLALYHYLFPSEKMKAREDCF